MVANKPLVRVSNNGISAIIDHNGNIMKSSVLNEVSRISYKLKISKTISYDNFHNLFKYYLVFLFFVLLILNRKNSNAK